MTSQPTATDFLREATHFVSYAAFLHLKRYNSVLTMSSQSKGRVHWTEEEVSALVDYLHDKHSEGEGGAFKKTTFQGAVSHLKPFHKHGAPKDANSVKEKFTKVSFKLNKFHFFQNNNSSLFFTDQGPMAGNQRLSE